MVGKILVVWLGLLGLAILTGAVREKLIRPLVGEAIAHILGTLLFCVEIALVAALFVVRLDVRDTATLWLTGAIWLGLTILFEFGFFHFVMKQPWSKLLVDYDLRRGRIWVLVLITTFFSPVLAGFIIGGQ